MAVWMRRNHVLLHIGLPSPLWPGTHSLPLSGLPTSLLLPSLYLALPACHGARCLSSCPGHMLTPPPGVFYLFLEHLACLFCFVSFCVFCLPTSLVYTLTASFLPFGSFNSLFLSTSAGMLQGCMLQILVHAGEFMLAACSCQWTDRESI